MISESVAVDSEPLNKIEVEEIAADATESASESVVVTAEVVTEANDVVVAVEAVLVVETPITEEAITESAESSIPATVSIDEDPHASSTVEMANS